MINRKIDSYIENFLRNEKKALLISGARQVGKTYSVREVSKRVCNNLVEFNFVENPDLVKIFEDAKNAKDLLLRISASTHVNLVPGDTIIFFDEVQACPNMVTSIKFLVDEGSYRYILSGSLLGVELKDIRSVPVGYLVEKQMFPLDLEEFAKAVGMSDAALEHVAECFEKRMPVDSVVHAKMLDLVRLYLIVGGMPAVVQKYLNTNNLQEVCDEQKGIVYLYQKDITKYDPQNKLYIKDIFDMIPGELNAKNKRFILKSLNENAKFDRYKNSFLWLADAGVALPTYNIEEPRIPLKLGMFRNLFKLFLSDIGLLASLYSSGLQQSILSGELNINFGAIYENLAAQELRAHGYDLYYFNNKKQGELDFVVEYEGRVLPIEIKSGKDYKRHNALNNVLSSKEYNLSMGIVFSNGQVEQNDNILYLPVYMLMCLKPSTLFNPIFRFEPI